MARLQMLAVAAAASLAGFLTTFTLLHLHIEAMWLRYGLSVIAAYGVFLLMIRAWTQRYRSRPELVLMLRFEQREGCESWIGWSDILEAPLDLLDALDFEHIVAAILLVLVCVTFGVLIGSTANLMAEWIAELVMDGAIGAAAYRGLRRSTIPETVGPFVCLFIVFVVAGVVCHAYAPEAQSIGGVIHHAALQRR